MAMPQTSIHSVCQRVASRHSVLSRPRGNDPKWLMAFGHSSVTNTLKGLNLIEQCFTSPPTQCRLYGRRFYRSKDPTNSIKVLKENLQRKTTQKNIKKTENTHTQKSIQITVTQINTASPLVYNNMG